MYYYGLHEQKGRYYDDVWYFKNRLRAASLVRKYIGVVDPLRKVIERQWREWFEQDGGGDDDGGGGSESGGGGRDGDDGDGGGGDSGGGRGRGGDGSGGGGGSGGSPTRNGWSNGPLPQQPSLKLQDTGCTFAGWLNEKRYYNANKLGSGRDPTDQSTWLVRAPRPPRPFPPLIPHNPRPSCRVTNPTILILILFLILILILILILLLILIHTTQVGGS